MSMPCRHWARGYCERGDQCGFLHPGGQANSAGGAMGGGAGMAVAQAQGMGINPMSAMLMGAQQGQKRPGAEMGSLADPQKRQKTILCRHFARGYCQLGDTCGFAHEPSMMGDVAAPAPQVVAAVPFHKPVFPQLSQMGGFKPAHGMGKGGAVVAAAAAATAATSNAGYKKTKLCYHFEGGNCGRGAACTFAHGEHELGMPQPDPVAPAVAVPVAVPVKVPVMIAPRWSTSSGGGAMMAAPQAQGAWGKGGGNGYLKTKLCHHFANGYCQRGSACTFAHGDHEIGTSQPAEQPQQQQPVMQLGALQMGGPQMVGSRTKEDVMLYNFKTTLCKDFVADGLCPRGDACSFAHGEAELQQPGDVMKMVTPTAGSNMMGMGKSAGKGIGKGKAQTRSQEDIQLYNFKTTLCRDFSASGSCPRGEACSFAHGEGELQQPGEVLQALQNPMEGLEEAAAAEATGGDQVVEDYAKSLGLDISHLMGGQ